MTPKDYCQCDFPLIRNGEYCGNCGKDLETGNIKDEIYKIVGEHTERIRNMKTLYDLALITEKTNKDLNTLFTLHEHLISKNCGLDIEPPKK